MSLKKHFVEGLFLMQTLCPTAFAQMPQIFYNANIYTFDKCDSRVHALQIEGGIITHIFTDKVPQELEGERIDLDGATLLPGLQDAHFHLEWLGRTLQELDCKYAASKQELLERLKLKAQNTPQGEWISGNGWDETAWENILPLKREDLDSVTSKHPVFLTRIDGHAAWLNTQALKLAQIDRNTPSPKGGQIIHDELGDPSGILIDNALSLAKQCFPPTSTSELSRYLLSAIELCQQAGLTGVHDMGITPESLSALDALEAEGLLSLRVTAYIRGSKEELEPIFKEKRGPHKLVQLAGVKLFMDGALGSHGAYLKAPYTDKPDTQGLLLLTQEELEQQGQWIHDAGYQLAIHAIGDGANNLALAAIETIEAGDFSRRHRIEHAQIIDPLDFEKFARLHVISSMQPTHCTSDMNFVGKRLGEERLRGAYSWQSLNSHNVVLALGSDAPVESYNPWLGIYAATTRQDENGQPPEGFMPNERLTVSQALKGFFWGPAYAAHSEDKLGSIAIGKYADFTVIDQDPFACSPAYLSKIRTLQTYTAGQKTYDHTTKP